MSEPALTDPDAEQAVSAAEEIMAGWEKATWTAFRKDGSTYHDLNTTFAELEADPELDALVLQRGPHCVSMKLPVGAKPWFLRRARPMVSSQTGQQVGGYEFAACIGWQRDGVFALAWLMHDGSVVLTDQTDLDELSH